MRPAIVVLVVVAEVGEPGWPPQFLPPGSSVFGPLRRGPEADVAPCGRRRRFGLAAAWRPAVPSPSSGSVGLSTAAACPPTTPRDAGLVAAAVGRLSVAPDPSGVPDDAATAATARTVSTASTRMPSFRLSQGPVPTCRPGLLVADLLARRRPPQSSSPPQSSTAIALSSSLSSSSIPRNSQRPPPRPPARPRSMVVCCGCGWGRGGERGSASRCQFRRWAVTAAVGHLGLDSDLPRNQ